MSERKARFRFLLDPKIAIDNKRVLSHLASRQVNDCVAFTNRASLHLDETLNWMRHLAGIEDKLLSSDALDEVEEEIEDRRLVREALDALLVADRALKILRLRKMDAALAFEESLDPIFAPKQPVKGKPKSKTVARNAPELELMPLLQVPIASPAPESAEPSERDIPKPFVVKLDPTLLEQARRELAERGDDLDE